MEAQDGEAAAHDAACAQDYEEDDQCRRDLETFVVSAGEVVDDCHFGIWLEGVRGERWVGVEGTLWWLFGVE